MTSQIDLSQYLNKKVRVTLRNNETYEGKITLNEGDNFHFPYRFQPDEDVYFRAYTVTGSQYTIDCGWRFNIMKIEEMNEIEELKNKVKELQEQIDRLEAKDEKEVPKIKCIEVTRTIVYDPECYLKYCLNKKVRPSQSGFVYYMKACFDDNFALSDYYEQEIKELEVWNED